MAGALEAGRSRVTMPAVVCGARLWQRIAMVRTILVYALAIAAGAAALQWLEYRYLVRAYSAETYTVLVAVAFAALGIWFGYRLTARPPPLQFERNHAAIRSLGLSPREIDNLDSLASGESNKEMARRLGISPNTVKTHVARIYAKLDVSRRMQAVEKGRFLALIP